MSIIYAKFQSENDKVLSKDCTTRWSDNIKCNIPMSGIYENKYTNLMILDGDEQLINSWLADNVGKVVEITEEDGDIIGQTMVPEGTTTVQQNVDGEVTLVAGLFTIAGGQTWTPVEIPE